MEYALTISILWQLCLIGCFPDNWSRFCKFIISKLSIVIPIFSRNFDNNKFNETFPVTVESELRKTINVYFLSDAYIHMQFEINWFFCT